MPPRLRNRGTHNHVILCMAARERESECRKCVSSLESFGRVPSDHKDPHLFAIPAVGSNRSTPRTDERKRHEAALLLAFTAVPIASRLTLSAVGFSRGKGPLWMLPMLRRVCWNLYGIDISKCNLARAKLVEFREILWRIDFWEISATLISVAVKFGGECCWCKCRGGFKGVGPRVQRDLEIFHIFFSFFFLVES